ncbi:MAG: hypothetical protein JO240_04345 [Solirubrobacterales bacterium]|nr:hypothetical protein [Solirubrobacterales bacterium]
MLSRGSRELEAIEPLAFLQGQQVAAAREPVVLEQRLDALLPLGPRVRERVPQPNPSA